MESAGGNISSHSPRSRAPRRSWKSKVQTHGRVDPSRQALWTCRSKDKIDFWGAAIFGGTTNDELVLIPDRYQLPPSVSSVQDVLGKALEFGLDHACIDLLQTESFAFGHQVNPFNRLYSSGRSNNGRKECSIKHLKNPWTRVAS